MYNSDGGNNQSALNDIQTNKESATKEDEGKKDKKSGKQVIYLTSRVHPGEANASFMIHGAIEFLL